MELRLRFAEGCGRLHSVWLTQSLNPQAPRVKREPLLRLGEKPSILGTSLNNMGDLPLKYISMLDTDFTFDLVRQSDSVRQTVQSVMQAAPKNSKLKMSEYMSESNVRIDAGWKIQW